MSSTSSAVTVEINTKPERTLVLLGKTGNGKSATGNTILGETQSKFLSRSRGNSITKECQLLDIERDGQKINVIDTPGLFSVSSTREFTIKEIIRCLLLAKNGIDAVLLVFSVRNRLTEEERSTVRTLKILFGDKIVDYMIVVFTNEDVLVDNEDTIDDYLADCSELQEIIKECNGRKVLFDNRSKIPESKKEKQVKELLNLVEEISQKNKKPYMSDISLEIMANRAIYDENQKIVETMKGVSSKKEIAEMRKEMEKSYNEKLEGTTKKMYNRVEETLKGLSEQLAKAVAAREEAEKKMAEIQKLSSDEVRRVREQLNKAERQIAYLGNERNKRCSIL